MRLVTAAVLAVLCLVSPASAGGACHYTQGKFLFDATRDGMKLYAPDRKATAAVIAKLNEVRVSQGKAPFDLDGFYIGIKPVNGQLMAGVVFMKDKCVVSDATLIVEAGLWAQALTALGLTDSDFELLSGA